MRNSEKSFSMPQVGSWNPWAMPQAPAPHDEELPVGVGLSLLHQVSGGGSRALISC